MAEGLDE